MDKHCYDNEFMEELKIKMNQHEETIAQLLAIVATTNKRLACFIEKFETPV